MSAPPGASRIGGSRFADVLSAAVALALPLLPLAWRQGYRTTSVVLCLGMAVAVWWSASVVADCLSSADGPAGRVVRTAILAVAFIVSTGFILDGLHALTLPGYVAAASAGAVVAFSLQKSNTLKVPSAPQHSSRRVTPNGAAPPGAALAWIPPSHVSLVGLAAAAALVAFALGFAATHAPRTLYDALSYHLYFSARWLQDHAISILATPFSDEAQAYAPANGELFFLWLMMPWHGDFLARAGELPFWWLGAVALYAIARRLGAARAHAWYPALLFMFARPVLEQAVGADVDLVAAACFAASIYLGLVAVDRDRWADWLVWGVAVGLTTGTKYVCLVYLPVLLSVAVANGVRRRALWAIPGLAVFGASWYVRNWVVAGSPIYPASVIVGGLTIAHGAFTREAMLNTVFHTRDLSLAPAILAHTFGVTLAFVAWPLACLGLVAMVRRGWWPYGWLASVPFVMAVLFWTAVPVNIDSRFLLPAVPLALVPVAFAFGRSRARNAAVHVIGLAGLAWIVIGTPHAITLTVPWFMSDWFQLNGLVSPASLAAFALVGGLLAMGWLAAARSRWVVPTMTLLVASTGTVLAVGEHTRCAPAPCDRLQVTNPFVRPGLVNAWDWMDDHVHDVTVAYTGINLPYPLAGPHLTNRVVYANIDGHPGWRFHDYDRAYRAGRFAPVPPALATSSGELESVPSGLGPRDDALRPRYERLEGFPSLWMHNLDALGVRDVFIARLSAYEIDYQVHGSDGFPVEDGWAQAAPSRFTLVFANDDARLYAVGPTRHAP
jgi:hypothetical protein